MARSLEWVPGPIYNVTTGAQGWLLWLSLSIMLADSLSSLVMLAVKSIAAAVRNRRESRDVVDPALPEEQVRLVFYSVYLPNRFPIYLIQQTFGNVSHRSQYFCGAAG